MTDKNTKYLIVRIPYDQWLYLKQSAAKDGLPMYRIVSELLDDYKTKRERKLK